MITPLFDIIQDDEFIIVRMRVKYVRASECEFYIWGTEFKFYCKPYFLKLTFPHPLVDDGREKATYDIEKGELLVYLPKLNKGQFFEGMDMITKLMGIKNSTSTDAKATGASSSGRPLIEVVGNEQPKPDSESVPEEEEEFDWSYPQTIPKEEECNPLNIVYYGFADKYSDFFRNLQEELHEILDNPEPDKLKPEMRRQQRILHENLNFDIDHYMADFMQDEEIREIMAFETIWKRELQMKKEKKAQLQAAKARLLMAVAQQNSSDGDAKPLETHLLRDKAPLSVYDIQQLEEEIVPFSDIDKDTMQRLPNKEYLIDDERSVFLGLVDIIFAYAYNYRITMGENTVESCWTIAKVSPTLSWLDKFSHPKEVVIAVIRRILCFPLYRHYELALLVFEDLKQIFKLGKRAILRCLLDIKRLFDKSDSQHYFNRLYIEDYCVWIQSVSRKRIHMLARELKKVTFTKSEIGLDLDEVEELAREAAEENMMLDNNSAASAAVGPLPLE